MILARDPGGTDITSYYYDTKVVVVVLASVRIRRTIPVVMDYTAVSRRENASSPPLRERLIFGERTAVSGQAEVCRNTSVSGSRTDESDKR